MIEHNILKELKLNYNLENIYFEFPFDFSKKETYVYDRSYPVQPKHKHIMIRNDRKIIIDLFIKHIIKEISNDICVVLFSISIMNDIITFTYNIITIE